MDGSRRRPTLLLIDWQKAFDDPRWGPRNNPDAEDNATKLLSSWRAASGGIVHVRHTSSSPAGLFRPGTEAVQFKPGLEPIEGEEIVSKSVNSAFIGTNLERRLRERGVDELVICGLTTDHCCSTTARMAGNLGFTTWFVGDAAATFDRRAPDGETLPAALMHRTALASLHGEFAEVISTEEALALIRP